MLRKESNLIVTCANFKNIHSSKLKNLAQYTTQNTHDWLMKTSDHIRPTYLM